MRNTLSLHVWAPNIYGTSPTLYLIIFLKVISKVLFFNTTQKFTNSLVQLSIFLTCLFVKTSRLSSHAKLEAFVIQTKPNYSNILTYVPIVNTATTTVPMALFVMVIMLSFNEIII